MWICLNVLHQSGQCWVDTVRTLHNNAAQREMSWWMAGSCWWMETGGVITQAGSQQTQMFLKSFPKPGTHTCTHTCAALVRDSLSSQSNKSRNARTRFPLVSRRSRGGQRSQGGVFRQVCSCNLANVNTWTSTCFISHLLPVFTF